MSSALKFRSLRVVFWGYCVLGSVLVVGLPNLFASYIEDWPLWAGIALAFIVAGYVIWAHALLWIRAGGASSTVLRYACRGYVLLLLVIMVGSAFVPSSKDSSVELIRLHRNSATQ